MVDFPHLGDTRFPNLGTVNAYAFRNEFDYSRWNVDTEIKLCNVLWNSTYDNVVKFDSDSERDAWFDELEGHSIVLKTNQTVTPSGEVKLPLPYDVAARYNYIVVRNPMITPDGKPVEYEDMGGIRTWYFFIDSMTYAAPSTTVLRISADIWTNFINSVDIKYMMLERGHAPVHATDVDSYLKNPLANNRLLLAPDVNFSDDEVTKDMRLLPVGSGSKYICVASTCAPDQISSLGTTVVSDDNLWSKPTYSSVPESAGQYLYRCGTQLIVNGYAFGNGTDYSGLSTPAANWNNSSDLIPNNLHVYAIPTADTTFFSDVHERCPQFLYTVEACYMVSEDMISISAAHSIAEHLVYDVSPVEGKYAIRLSKDMFGYPSRYAGYAKLYTMPYATIELSDTSGNSVTVRVEDTTDALALRTQSAVAFPYLNFRAFLEGTNGTKTHVMKWRRLDGSELDTYLHDGDWRRYCIDMDIPTYALYMDGATSTMLGSYNRSIANARRQALVNYHVSMRNANTARENAYDLADTAYGNVKRVNATMVANMANTQDTAWNNMDTSEAALTSNVATGNRYSLEMTRTNNLYSQSTVHYANQAMTTTTDINNHVTTETTSNNGTSAMITGGINGVVNGMQSGAGAGGEALGVEGAAAGAVFGAVIGGLQGVATAGIAAHFNNVNADIVKQGNEQTTTVAAQANSANYVFGVDNALAQTGWTATDRVEERATSSTAAHTCQTRIRNTNNTNASNSAATSNECARQTNATSRYNSLNTRYVAELDAKEILENAQESARSAYLDGRNVRPIALTASSGDPSVDAYANRAVQVKVRTQPDGAIAQAGDTFARYGYALNQVWDVAEGGLNLMRNFTYWKASDVWVDDRGSGNAVINAMISDIFTSGVTVWSTPDKIGKVSIYDN